MTNIPEFMEGILEFLISSSVVQTIFDIVLATVMIIVAVLLLPVSLLIKQFFPEYNANLSELSTVFTLVLDYTGWIVSALGIPSFMLTLVSGYFIFVLSTRIVVFFFKHALHWYKALKI